MNIAYTDGGWWEAHSNNLEASLFKYIVVKETSKGRWSIYFRYHGRSWGPWVPKGRVTALRGPQWRQKLGFTAQAWGSSLVSPLLCFLVQCQLWSIREIGLFPHSHHTNTDPTIAEISEKLDFSLTVTTLTQASPWLGFVRCGPVHEMISCHGHLRLAQFFYQDLSPIPLSVLWAISLVCYPQSTVYSGKYRTLDVFHNHDELEASSHSSRDRPVELGGFKKC